MAQGSVSRPLQAAFIVAIGILLFATGEFGMRYTNRPKYIISGWRATDAEGPRNQLGLRGRPWPVQRPRDFVVVMTGAEAVECHQCPPDETLDLILERALRQYNQAAQVVTLGSAGYGQDQQFLALQEYLTHQRADLVIAWASIAEDVPRNTFRTGQPRPDVARLKPTFALIGNELRGPTESIGEPLYRLKFTTLLMPFFVDPDRTWNKVLPPAEPGSGALGNGPRSQVDDLLEEQRSAWSIWLSPQPARVRYGLDLTRQLLRRMRDLAKLHGAPFTLFLTPSDAGAPSSGPIALEHAGHWFVADPAVRDAAIAEVAQGFDSVSLSPEAGQTQSPQTERQLMARLAETLNQRNLLNSAGASRPRH